MYSCRFPRLILDWRQHFNNDRLSFYFVLLAALKSEGVRWAVQRQAQLQALTLPYTGVASAQDLGDQVLPPGPEGAGHSRNKTLIGERLALLARSDVYNEDHVVSVGPQLVDVVWPLSSQGAVVQSVILRFRGGARDADGLILRDTSDCDVCCGGAVKGSPITVKLSDGRVELTEVRVFPSSYTVVASVNVTEGQRVIEIALNWDSYAQCSLYNKANLPCLPFNITRGQQGRKDRDSDH
jgi:sialate O-acetylesterase